ncbi:unnamed protein product [Calypogeia fissa]
MLSREVVVKSLQSLRHVLVSDGKSSRELSASLKMREEGWILLPEVVSTWPSLFAFSSTNSTHVIALFDKYLDPQCSLVEKIVTEASGLDSMLEFIKDAFNAVDLPLIKLPAGESIYFPRPISVFKSLSMLEWLKMFLPNRKTTKLEHKNDGFLRTLKEFSWMKTYHHGWQSPSSVFFSVGFFKDRFTAHDLPFLDVPAYGLSNFTGDAAEAVFEELGLVTKVKKGKGRAAIVRYFSTCSATKLDLEAVTRFYKFFHDVASRDQIHSLKIWIPAGATNKEPMWKDPAECIISDELGIFVDSNTVTVLDKIYDVKSVHKALMASC